MAHTCTGVGVVKENCQDVAGSLLRPRCERMGRETDLPESRTWVKCSRQHRRPLAGAVISKKDEEGNEGINASFLLDLLLVPMADPEWNSGEGRLFAIV